MTERILVEKELIKSLVIKGDIWQIRAYALAQELILRGINPQRTMDANKTELVAYLLNSEEMIRKERIG